MPSIRRRRFQWKSSYNPAVGRLKKDGEHVLRHVITLSNQLFQAVACKEDYSGTDSQIWSKNYLFLKALKGIVELIQSKSDQWEW